MSLSGTKEASQIPYKGSVLKITETVKKTTKGMKWSKREPVEFFVRLCHEFNIKEKQWSVGKCNKLEGIHFKYITVYKRKYQFNSISGRARQPLTCLQYCKGFFVEISRPEKNDWEIPIYNTGSMFTMKNIGFIIIILKSQKPKTGDQS